MTPLTPAELLIALRAEQVIRHGEPFAYEIDGLMGEGTTGDIVQRRNPNGPQAADTIERLEARVAEAERALKPFALAYQGYPESAHDAEIMGADDEVFLQVGHFRAAANFLATKGAV